MNGWSLAFVLARLLVGVWLLWSVRGPASHLVAGRRTARLRPSCSVIVPARDEAQALPRLLAAVRSQLRPGDELVVVDDHSTDTTAAVAAEGGADVLSAPPLPPDWLGKTWAASIGASRATGAVLVFLDADTTLAPGALDRLVEEQALQGGLVSAQPWHRVPTAAEKLSALFNVVALMGTEAHTPLGPTHPPRGAYGPVLVVGRHDYEALGGHATVADEVLDDVRLSRVWQRSGRPVHLYAGRDLASFRMYPGGLKQLVEGWTKNFAAGATAIRPVTLAAIVLWLSLLIQAAWTLGRLAVPGPDPMGAAAAAALYGVVVAQLWWMLRRVGSFGLATAVLYPVPLACFLAVFARSVALTAAGRPVRWKGRWVASRPQRARGTKSRSR